MRHHSIPNAVLCDDLQVVEQFAPAAIVMQCGASGLAADRLGSFNLTQNGGHRTTQHRTNWFKAKVCSLLVLTRSHVCSAAYSAAVGFVCQMGKPTLLLGGGGYSLGKVARCWTAVTAAAVVSRLSVPSAASWLACDSALLYAKNAVLHRVKN